MTKKLFMPLAAILLLLTASCKEPRYDLEDGLYAEFVTTKDTMVAKLFYKEAPVTVANFVALAEGKHPLVKEEYKGKKYYNGTTFHRVINDFMIQGGDPTATGSGDPGYKFEDEFSNDLKHTKPGILSMANSGPNTNGSQFFITEKATQFLDAYQADGTLKKCGRFPGGGCHAVFGELVLGLDVQDSISNVKVQPGSNKPLEDVVIKELNIIRIGSEAKKFDAAKEFTEGLPKLKEQQEKAAEEARLKAEEEKKAAEEKKAEAAAEFKPTLDDYMSKAKALPSGLKVHYLNKGTGTKPKTGQMAMINYQGYFTDGKLLDSNIEECEERYGMLNPMKVQRNMYAPTPMKISPDAQLFAGFREALAMMRVGDKAFFYFPSHLAYGESGRPPVVQPNTDLAFIIEMVDIQK
ncbi:cyclophilin family peptidyl-prolyl cis-trans isomerase [Winogradskyella wandonensis]|uniref:peptidylprolyl isomerase n=1 Tax=Winogradskyella wandonensis TaxID=1442586 RepID=A0A4R1KVN2_9FLAO|nr:peptidylprolyl isomerase [Winogradskyella wandonensis]TCK68763.1 cyclophilin family peptidyl-prolyl cis-trans isomerase [Winogradskyella wandonensis]